MLMSLSEGFKAAMRAGDLSLARDFLGRGANPNTVADGYPAICTAAMTGSVECVDLLASFGADVNRASHDGCTAAMWAAMLAPKELVGAVLESLVKHGARLDACDPSGRTALDWAVRLQNQEAALWLHSHGCRGRRASVEYCRRLGKQGRASSP